MSRRKEMYLVIDTETCNTVEQPLPYDIGFAICDRMGNIAEERSYVVAETFLDMKDTMKDKWLWLDMDGTFADLYGVNGWLDDLVNLRTRPYAEAKPIYNMVDFLLLLVELKQRGWKIGIISWLSKDPDAEYGERVTKAKNEWLYKWCMDIVLDKVLIVPYGQCKADTCRQFGYGVLADDEEQNRNAWDLGETIDANKNLLEELAKLL